jgi:hypothetical protein
LLVSISSTFVNSPVVKLESDPSVFCVKSISSLLIHIRFVLYFRTVNIYLVVSFPKVLDALFQRILTQSNLALDFHFSGGRKED